VQFGREVCRSQVGRSRECAVIQQDVAWQQPVGIAGGTLSDDTAGKDFVFPRPPFFPCSPCWRKSCGVGGLFRSELMLHVGLPLVAGLHLDQFAGVLAHELAHAAQTEAPRSSRQLLMRAKFGMGRAFRTPALAETNGVGGGCTRSLIPLGAEL
jgi:hypothetical protein